jgi:hypothetical protein
MSAEMQKNIVYTGNLITPEFSKRQGNGYGVAVLLCRKSALSVSAQISQ